MTHRNFRNMLPIYQDLTIDRIKSRKYINEHTNGELKSIEVGNLNISLLSF